MPLTPQQILGRLVVILPEFLEHWESRHSSFRDNDGSFTQCGVLAECSHFVRDHYDQLSSLQRHQLADFVLECMRSTDTDLRDAAATCFLENLSFERFSNDFETYLAGNALDFYRQFQQP